MAEKYRSIYQLARIISGLTQLEASERLHVNVRTLGKYESGEIIPNPDIVANMVQIYGTPWLGYEHLRQSSELGRQILPPINIDDLAKSVLILQKETADVERIKNEMIQIACDGIIEEHEKQSWDGVLKEVLEMAGAALSLVFTNKKDLSAATE